MNAPVNFRVSFVLLVLAGILFTTAFADEACNSGDNNHTFYVYSADDAMNELKGQECANLPSTITDGTLCQCYSDNLANVANAASKNEGGPVPVVVGTFLTINFTTGCMHAMHICGEVCLANGASHCNNLTFPGLTPQ